MCSMKCTDSGAGTGSGAVHTVQCAVCSVQCPACNRQTVSTSNQIMFLMALNKKQKFCKTNMNQNQN